jgi:chromosome partition protein MukE
MSRAEYALLQDVIMDADFPELDLALRRGRHVDRDDAGWYALLTDAQELLEPFYRRYGCELIHKTDGYFYLLPTGEKVSRKQLSATDMLVGQALALLYLDPSAVERGGVVTQEDVVSQLSAVLGSDALIGLFSPGKRKKQDERIAQRNVRQRVGEALRRLGQLGFVELSDASALRLRAALLRFAEPVRGLSEPAEALAKLVALGEVALEPEAAGSEDDVEDSDRAVRESDIAPRGSAQLEGDLDADGGVTGVSGFDVDGGSDGLGLVSDASGVPSDGLAELGDEHDAAEDADDERLDEAYDGERFDGPAVAALDSDYDGASPDAAEPRDAELSAAVVEAGETGAPVAALSGAAGSDAAESGGDGEGLGAPPARKSRVVIDRDDLDWADILPPGEDE